MNLPLINDQEGNWRRTICVDTDNGMFYDSEEVNKNTYLVRLITSITSNVEFSDIYLVQR